MTDSRSNEAKRLEAEKKAREIVIENAKNVRQQVVESLRSRLPSCYEVRPYDRKGDHGGEYFGVTVKRAQCEWFKFEFGFRVESANRFYSLNPHYKLSIVDRNGRSFAPLYEFDKKGMLNMSRMSDDVERAYESGRIYHERNKARASRTEFSHWEFIKVCEQTGVQPGLYGSSYGTLNLGKYKVEVNAGDYADGKVYVKIALAEPYLSAEEAVKVIKALRHA